MPAPGEYKTVQARILLYAQEIGWTFVPRAEAEARRGFKPDGSMPADRARGASLFFNDTLYAQVKKLNPRFAGSMGDVTGRLNALKPDIFGNRDFRNKCGTRRSRPGGSSGVAVVRFAEQSLQTRPMKHWKDKAEFKGRILHWADKLGVRVRMATVRSMRNKWASCSTAGNLHLNVVLDTDAA